MEDNMSLYLVMKQPRIIIQGLRKDTKDIFIKICVGQKIYRFYNTRWIGFGRLQIDDPIRIPIQNDNTVIEMEVLINQKPYPKVIAEAQIKASFISKVIRKVRQVKVSLSLYDLIVGWFYFECYYQQNPLQIVHSQVFYLKQIYVKLLKQLDKPLQMSLFHQNQELLKKVINKKCLSSLFTNQLTINVKLSSLLKFSFIRSLEQSEMKFFILIDSIERGKVVSLNYCLNDKQKRVGDVEIKYFLENIFLPNPNNLEIKILKLKQQKRLQSCPQAISKTYTKPNQTGKIVKQERSNTKKSLQNSKFKQEDIDKKVEQIQQYIKKMDLKKSTSKEKEKKKKLDYYFYNAQNIN